MKLQFFSIVFMAKVATFCTMSMPNLKKSNGTTNTSLVQRCVEVFSGEGVFEVNPTQSGSNQETSGGRACGIYLVAKHDSNIRVEVLNLNLAHQDTELVAFFDGWEMNGKIFPSEYDHHHSIGDRSVIVLNSTPQRFNSSQNAAMVQYKISPQSTFAIRVTHLRNPEPCNILMSADEEVLTLKTPAGSVRNCSLTSMLFPAIYRVESPLRFGAFSLPLVSMDLNPYLRDLVCRATRDRLIIGGSNSLESTHLLESLEVRCNDHHKVQKGFAVLCESSTVKLVSSGRFNNEVRIFAKAASADDFNTDDNHVQMCPFSEEDYDYPA